MVRICRKKADFNTGIHVARPVPGNVAGGLGNQARLRRGVAPRVVAQALAAPGRKLDPAARGFFERRFGYDFSAVRVHTGPVAAASTQAVAARAYTVGPQIVFGAGEYAPGTAEGRRLLAHELSHVVQQSQGAAPTTLQRYPVPANLKCAELAGWMDAHSPYAPEWAQTNCQYSFNGDLDVTPPRKTGAGVSLTAKGNPKLTVSVDCPTDLPEWSPSGREGRTAEFLAWTRMIKVLDTHEARHRAIGQRWRTTLESGFRATNVTATGTDEADARANLSTKLAEDQQKQQEKAQAAQSKIDPFRGAVLNCPAPATEMDGILPRPDKVSDGTGPAAPALLNETPPQPKPLSPELQKLFP